MANTKIILDRQAAARIFPFGTTAASEEALVTINKGTAAVTTVVLDVKASAAIAGDLNLTGDLNVAGAINSTSVTNTNVKDITITLNDGGTTAAAADGGIIMEGTGNTIIGKISFDNTLASKWSIGDGTTQREIVDVSSVQTITNKVIGGVQISGNISGNAGNVTGTVAVANGGTGAITFTAGYLKASGTSAFTTVATIAGADVSGNISGNATNVTGTVAVANGGTGVATLTAYAPIFGGTTATGPVQSGTVGTAGQVLTSNGPGVLPTFQASSSGVFFRATTVTGTQDATNKVFTIGNAVSTASEQVFLNGQLLTPGSSNDYIISGTTVTFQAAISAPTSTDVIRVYGNY